MTINQLKIQLLQDIELARWQMNENLGKISDLVDKPLPSGHSTMESAIMARMRHVEAVVARQHALSHELKADKGLLKKIEGKPNHETHDQNTERMDKRPVDPGSLAAAL